MGGAELQAHYLEKEALLQSWASHYCFVSNGRMCEKHSGTILHPIPQKNTWSKLGNIKYPYAGDLLRALKEISPDVIYQRGGFAFTGIAALYAQKNNCRFVFHIAGDRDVQKLSMPWQKPYMIPELKLMRYGIIKADLIIAQTRSQAEELMRNYDRKAVLIPNGHPVPSDSAKSSDKISILWIANWKTIKQPEVFVRLAEEIGRREDVRFVMIGRKDRYEKLVEKAIQNNIEVKGEIVNDEVNQLLAASHILVNTSRQEGFSNTFIQAWLRRVPVVSLQVDPDDILQREQIGFCSGSFEKLVQDTKRLIADHRLRDSMGQKAREYAVKHHSLDNMKQLLQVFSSLMEASSGAM
jgi:glycosyltransferase involved in cell wall biosynthesis